MARLMERNPRRSIYELVLPLTYTEFVHRAAALENVEPAEIERRIDVEHLHVLAHTHPFGINRHLRTRADAHAQLYGLAHQREHDYVLILAEHTHTGFLGLSPAYSIRAAGITIKE